MISVTQDGRGARRSIHYAAPSMGITGTDRGVQLTGCLQLLWTGGTHWVLPEGSRAGAFPPSLHEPHWLKMCFLLLWSCRSSSQARSWCKSLPLQPVHAFSVPPWGSNKSICTATAQHACWSQCISLGLRAPGKQAHNMLWFCKKTQSSDPGKGWMPNCLSAPYYEHQ